MHLRPSRYVPVQLRTEGRIVIVTAKRLPICLNARGHMIRNRRARSWQGKLLNLDAGLLCRSLGSRSFYVKIIFIDSDAFLLVFAVRT
jgi:hypothetical protein